MTYRHTLEHRRDSLTEIREIMNSMKTLAYMETRKLSRFLAAQQAAVHGIEEVAADFLAYYPETLPAPDHATRVVLLIGTERGFCGDFNQRLLLALEQLDAQALIVTGRKLHPLLEKDPRVAALLDGASVAEEVPQVLSRVVHELGSLEQRHGLLALHAVCHDENEVTSSPLLPAFEQLRRQTAPGGYPPELNLPPHEFLLDLTEQYLFAALHERLYTALMAENRNRVSHLDGAVRHLDETTGDLARRCNELRQEEIIEEIEIILLSTGQTGPGAP